jgi:hypothetical protein
MILACGSAEPAPRDPQPSTGEQTPNPTPAPSVTFERLDADPECDGLLPDHAPAPVEVARTPPTGQVCAGGSSDGTGSVAVAARGEEGASWQVYGAGGEPRGRPFSAWPVSPQPSGWHGLSVAPAGGPNGGNAVAHAVFGPDGTSLASHQVSRDPSLVDTHRWSLGADPLGGGMALVAQTDLFHNHWAGLRAQRFDPAGAPRWAEPVQFGARSEPTVHFVAAGVSRRGESLALWQHSALLDVSWQNAAGEEVTGAERAERSADVLGSDALAHAIDLVPLLDGGLAVRADGAFRRVYPHLGTASVPLPGWLAARAAWSFRLTRGNRGYALFPPPGAASADCGQAIELRAPSGRLCGRVILPGDGKPCATGILDQGWDGTVVQQRTADGCAYRFWPRLLGG